MIVNDRDVLLQKPGPRFSIVGNGIFLSGTSSTVRTAADGSAPSPASISLTATLLGITGTPVWSITGGTLVGTGDTARTLAASSMTSEVAVVSVKLIYAGVTFNASYSIAKVRDGSSGQGTPGARGAGHYYAQGFEWSNDKASAACPGGPRLNDVVTIAASSGTFALTKGWDGDSWEPLGQIFDGSLFVTQSISAGAIDARGLSIKDAYGNVILQAGQPLAESAVPASAQNSQLTPSIQAAAKTANYDLVNGRPEDVSNIVKKSSFEDNKVGGWTTAQGIEALVGTGAGDVPYTRQLVCRTRDTLETNNYFSVTPNETLYYEAWLNTEATTLQTCFGVIFLDKNGQFAGTSGTPYQNPGQGWRRIVGKGTVPVNAATAVPWLWENGEAASDFTNGNWLRATGMWIGRHARGATVGATWGVNVDGSNKPQDNATYGATLGTNVGGSINDSNAASLVTVTSLRVVSPKIGNYSTAGSGGRTDLNDSGMRIYDGNGAMRVRIGNLAN